VDIAVVAAPPSSRQAVVAVAPVLVCGLARDVLRAPGRALVRGALMLGALAIAAASVSYATEGALHPFVLEKQDGPDAIPFPALWWLALRVHVATAVVALPVCLALSSRRLLRRLPRLHRWLGRAIAVVVVVVVVPSGAVLAWSAKGGLPSTLGFLLSGAITAVAMVAGVRRARARDVRGHRRAMLQVTAQLAVAVTSRALLVAFDAAGVDEGAAYVLALWLPVIAHAVVAERVARAALGTPITPATPGDPDAKPVVPARLRLAPAR
jgi:uncharacterized membrane protein